MNITHLRPFSIAARALIVCLGCLLLSTTVSASRFEAAFHRLMRDAHKQANEQDWDSARATVAQLQALIERHDDNDDVGSIEYAWFSDLQRFVLYSTGEKEAALASCERAITRLTPTAHDWQYLRDYDIVRATLRACHNMHAWSVIEQADSLQALQPAFDHVAHVFGTRGVLEDDAVLDPFHAARAAALLKAASFHADFQGPAFAALKPFVTRNDLPHADHALIRVALQADTFDGFELRQPSAPHSYPTLADIPAAGQPPSGVGTQLRELAERCHASDWAACDTLFDTSPPDSVAQRYGQSCGGRAPSTEYYCGDISRKQQRRRATPVPANIEHAMVALAEACHQGVLRSCDLLAAASPAGSLPWLYGDTCGQRFHANPHACAELLAENTPTDADG
jgi:hypothetical protein